MIPATVIFVLALAWILSYLWLNQEVVSQIDVRNPEGKTGTALVVYHPGRGSFHSRVVSSLADGLISASWRVEVTTASAQAPTDLSSYDLLVLGSPTYWFTPSWTIQRFLRRLGDLGGQPTVTIISGMGAGERSASVMEKLIREANGNLVKGLLFYWMRPNDDDNYVNTDQNKALAVELAKQAGKEIPRSQGQA